MPTEPPDKESIDKLRQLVEELDNQSNYWTDDQLYWRATTDLAITAGDLRNWLVVIDGELAEE